LPSRDKVSMSLNFSKNLKLIKNNDNALPKTNPLARTIKLENYVHAALLVDISPKIELNLAVRLAQPRRTESLHHPAHRLMSHHLIEAYKGMGLSYPF